MNEPKPRLLLVEDEDHLAAGLKLNFELEGFEVDIARTGREAGSLLLQPDYDIMVLDVMLPDISGLTLCRSIRESGKTTPILMLTAKASLDDRVEGLNAGADDYLTKPFELEELLARVRSMLRRAEWEKQEEPQPSTPSIRIGSAQVDFERHIAERDGQTLRLTKLEFDLLLYFVENPERVLSREELQREVWKLRDYPNRRMVDNFIMRLRRHFEKHPQSPKMFVSVRGAGYKFVPPT
ncbi:MAG: response regulator transcription factor [Nannocystaceae bacterium]|nr:response regulator transcription factor [bacterium]